MTNDRIGNIIASLTLEEKASLARGKSFWETQDIPAKGVPSIWLADGPHGLRKEDRLHICLLYTSAKNGIPDAIGAGPCQRQRRNPAKQV